ncbi:MULTISPECIES: translation initiation factor IF-3 [Pseudodesulfovibrio]|jgi:translation initiation factor IF-3|uniref:Translation initiation factor IF-3 n=3 Tax=Pseudodesulfovibrio TaxID=2035811 RepID=A0A1J5N046_9BACT|nr:translation initiation factor IF-3 [Pseudodesulfovibrio hydrargyri]OIQ52173.1 Translation initiation factor IF-3 [Pseudodesulfovibrio hydrargyri]
MRRDQKREDLVRRNERIRIPKVRVVDDDGEQLGVMATRDALDRAREKGLDLVEVAPNADPPVCKIMDYGKFKYQQQKKLQEAKKKQTVIKIKEVKFRPKTDEHDYQTKLKQIVKFLEGGDRCKVTIFFRGREIVHKDRGLAMLERVVVDTQDLAKVESKPMSEGRTMTMMLAPVKK